MNPGLEDVPERAAGRSLRLPRGGMVFTVGYEGRSLEDILQLLKSHRIQVLLDVRENARAALGEYLPTLPACATHLFPSRRIGRGLSERAFGHLLRRYAARAGLVDVSPHDLRHRFGYRMAEAVPLHRLAQIMGHDSLDATMGYVRGTKADLRKEVESSHGNQKGSAAGCLPGRSHRRRRGSKGLLGSADKPSRPSTVEDRPADLVSQPLIL